MSDEAPDIREQEDCPGGDVCENACDQHQPCLDVPIPGGGVVRPLAGTPARELEVWQNEALRNSLARGLHDSAEGKIHDLGSFAEPVDADHPDADLCAEHRDGKPGEPHEWRRGRRGHTRVVTCHPTAATEPIVIDLDDPIFHGQTLPDALADYEHVHSTTGICVKNSPTFRGHAFPATSSEPAPEATVLTDDEREALVDWWDSEWPDTAGGALGTLYAAVERILAARLADPALPADERLAEIRAHSEAGSANWPDPIGDARWLLAEVERLRQAFADYVHDHPCDDPDCTDLRAALAGEEGAT